MPRYLAVVPVRFTHEPTEDALNDFNDALAAYDPRGRRGRIVTHRTDAGDITFSIIVESADDQEAKRVARETAASALLDTGHRSDAATVRGDAIEVIPG
ncbi:hypothetical protein ACWD33_06255 [Streptomyces xiamenensis]|uniref:hypothetical protein n=1 Tax=Streptomyces TaxID=1883 RepID=UPI0004C582C7|nr:hypothetical protein [Streptomyces sp. NRRL F-2890]